MNKNKKKFSRVCVPCSMYCLTYYLMMSSKEEIDDTFFFFAHSIPPSLREKFKNSYFIDLKDKWHRHNIFLSPYTLIKRAWKWPFLKKAEIYGLDFYWDLLRGLKMNYIEDGPFVFDIWETSLLFKSWQAGKEAHPVKRLVRRLLYGEYYLNPVGTSDMVKTIYSSHPTEKPYYKNKQYVVIDLPTAWEQSSKEKKEYLLSVYDITPADLAMLKSRDTIILTQPMYIDKVMSEQEQIDVYRRMVEQYGEANCIIKPHPRDLIDYGRLFPKAIFFNKAVPMQLFAILGVNFRKVVTVNSSSALSFGKDADIDWWAERLDYPKIIVSGVKTLAEAKSCFR